MRKLRSTLKYLVLLLSLVVALIAGVGIGSVALSPPDILSALGHRLLPGVIEPSGPAYVDTMIFDSRLPRVLLAAIVGAGLALVGMTMQAILKNPLADPYLLGVSSGASVGAVLSIVVFTGLLGAVTTPVFAFLGALGSMILVYLVARSGGRVTTLRLILAGVAVSYVFSAVTSLIVMLSPSAQQARSVMHWLLGGLAGAQWDMIGPLVLLLAGALIWLLLSARRLNLMFAGDDAALTMGLDVPRFRIEMFLVSSLLTGVLVAASGPIGFVGLMVPHAVRILFGADHRRALPAAALVGAIFLILADILARTIASPLELPVGILTSLCGGPFFLWLIRRETRRTSGKVS